MTAFLSNEPRPTIGRLRLYAACRKRDNTQPDKVSWDKATCLWLGVATPSLFFGGKTGLVSSLSCLNYSFGFPVYSLWPSLVAWRSYSWKPDNNSGETSSFPALLPLLKKVQQVVALEWLMRRGTEIWAAVLETEPLFLELVSPIHQWIINLHSFWTNM